MRAVTLNHSQHTQTLFDLLARLLGLGQIPTSLLEWTPPGSLWQFFLSKESSFAGYNFFPLKHSQNLIQQSLSQWFAHVTDAKSASVTAKCLVQDPMGEADQVGWRAPGEVAAGSVLCWEGQEQTWPGAAGHHPQVPDLKTTQGSTVALRAGLWPCSQDSSEPPQEGFQLLPSRLWCSSLSQHRQEELTAEAAPGTRAEPGRGEKHQHLGRNKHEPTQLHKSFCSGKGEPPALKTWNILWKVIMTFCDKGGSHQNCLSWTEQLSLPGRVKLRVPNPMVPVRGLTQNFFHYIYILLALN